MRWFVILLVFLLFALQTRLWVGEGSLAHKSELNRELAAQKVENKR